MLHFLLHTDYGYLFVFAVEIELISHLVTLEGGKFYFSIVGNWLTMMMTLVDLLFRK